MLGEASVSAMAVRRPRADRTFYSVATIAAAAAIVYGFARSWFFRPFLPPQRHPALLTPLIAFHGLVFSAWLVFAIAQPLLIGRGQYKLHRSLGYVGAGLAALMVVLMPLTAVLSMRAGDMGDFDDSGQFLAINFALAVEFAVIIALAIGYRNRAETHKRLILLSFVALLPPALARWPTVIGIPLFTCDLLIVAGMVYDRVVHKRIHAVWKWSLPVMLVAGVLPIVLGLQPSTKAVANQIIAFRQ